MEIKDVFERLVEKLEQAQTELAEFCMTLDESLDLPEQPLFVQRRYSRLRGRVDGLLTAIKLHQGEYIEVPA